MHDGMLVKRLVAMVMDSTSDLALELQPWEILIHARTHLANGLMNSGDVDAWQLLGQIQNKLLDGAPVCYIQYEADKAMVNCKEPVASWCGDCGESVCAYHMTVCCTEIRCEHCQFVHKATFHKWLDTQIN